MSRTTTRCPQPASSLVATEQRVPVADATLYARDVGQGPPLVVLHGGPDFDHRYFLPALDRLADSYRLIYYDQRGRGKSADGVRPEEVSLASELEDLGRVQDHFGLEAPVLFGHLWGAVLALEYVLRHPSRASALLLMNPAPASAADVTEFRKAYRENLGPDMERQRIIMAGSAYQAGDPESVAERYRIHFRRALKRDEDFEQLMATMQAAFTSQGSDGILKARAVEDRLMRDTWQLPGYDLLPKVRDLRIPALVISGDHDIIPVEVAEHIATAIPGAELVTLKNCGHFSYLESPDHVRNALDRFLMRNDTSRRG